MKSPNGRLGCWWDEHVKAANGTMAKETYEKAKKVRVRSRLTVSNMQKAQW